MECNNFQLPLEAWNLICSILRKGSTIELKLVGGRVDIVEIRRTVKHRLPPPTGEADG